MKKELEHTPTPWEIRIPYPVTIAEKQMKMAASTILIKSEENTFESIAQCYDTMDIAGSAVGNATFIIEAVNNYDRFRRLESAANKLVSILEFIADGAYKNDWQREKARKAIAVFKESVG